MNKPETLPAPMEVLTGSPHPLGATWDGKGVNFAIYSRHADKVELCLFDESGKRETQRIPLRERTDFVWHGYLPQARPGQLYGYRVHGPWAPAHDLNSNSVLIPVAFGVETDVSTDPSGTIHTSTTPPRAKGSSAPKGSATSPALWWSPEHR